MRGPIPEGMWGYDATAMQYNHDETKAKAEWDKVTSKPTSLTFLYSDNDPNWEPIALATQSSLREQAGHQYEAGKAGERHHARQSG
ncbi:hypothetical protein ACLB1M_12790 [Escherichia coli]